MPENKNLPAQSNGFTENGAAQIRPGAVPSPEVVNVFRQGVSAGADSKLRLVSFAGGPAGDAIGLSVQAWVRNLAFDKDIWLDLALVGPDGQVLHAQTLPLTYQEPAGEGGDFFALMGAHSSEGNRSDSLRLWTEPTSGRALPSPEP